jgi:hypothetical protein
MPVEIIKGNKVITIKILQFYLELGCFAIFIEKQLIDLEGS